MDRGQNREEQHQVEQPHISNPDLFLTLQNPSRFIPEDSDQNEQKPKRQQEQIKNSPKKNEKSVELQEQLKSAEQLIQFTSKGQKKGGPKKYKKKIKKASAGEDESSQFNEKKASKKEREGPQRKRQRDSTKNEAKTKKSKANHDEQIKKELTELIVQKDVTSQEKNMVNCKKQPMLSEVAKNQSTPGGVSWRHNKANEEDLNSLEAELCEQSIIHRSQSQAYRRLMDLALQQGQNMLQKWSDLPPLQY